MLFSRLCRTVLAAALLAGAFSAQDAYAAANVEMSVTTERGSNVGIIRGVVRDATGSPIAGATVSLIRNSTSKLFRQVAAGRDGSFLLKVLPGSYTLTAAANGFTPARLLGIEVGRAAELNYGIRLERAGSGNTLPETRVDRNSSKWRIRASQMNRSIYQNAEGEDPLAEEPPQDDRVSARKGQTIAETYFASNRGGSFAGVNAATFIPVGDDLDIVIAGQTGIGRSAPKRVETTVSFRAGSHNFRFTGSIGRLGILTGTNDAVNQATFQALDEWRIREGIIVVYGLDYSRFVGVEGESSISPRFGLLFDADPKTRVRASFTPQTVERSWARAMELEGTTFAFAEPVAIEDMAFVEGKPSLNRTSRLEFGVERVLDNRSSIDAAVFFDTIQTKGVGLNTFGPATLNGGAFSELTANQQGDARGIRVVYNRRLSGPFSASVGYSFGAGQKLSAAGLADPHSIFENDVFQSFYAQVSADLRSGTSVRTIYRLSPQATVFAIDPFKGRLAIYDPGLSVFVTQNLPTLGLPIRAEAIIDARNLLDLQANAAGEEGLIRLSSQRRMLMGGIQVRF